jgi:hypothetical protein
VLKKYSRPWRSIETTFLLLTTSNISATRNTLSHNKQTPSINGFLLLFAISSELDPRNNRFPRVYPTQKSLAMTTNLPSSFASAAAGQNANRDSRGARTDGRGPEWYVAFDTFYFRFPSVLVFCPCHSVRSSGAAACRTKGQQMVQYLCRHWLSMNHFIYNYWALGILRWPYSC